MIDITISNTPINNPASAYILGKVTADLKAFDEIESSDVVKSLFGVKEANPSAIDITQSIVNNLPSKEDKTKMRSILQDRGHTGVIWRFTSTKKFMLEMTKNIASSGNYLSLTLISMSNQPEVTVRELVRFNKDGVTFLDKRNKSVEIRPSVYDDLKRIHDEAVATLEKKLLEPQPVQEPTPSPKERTMEEKRASFGLELFDKTLVHPCVFVSKGTKVFFIRGESGIIYLHDYVNSRRICTLKGDQFVLEFGTPSDEGVVFEAKADIDDFDNEAFEQVAPGDLQRCFIDNLKAALYADYVKHDTVTTPPEEEKKEEQKPEESPKEEQPQEEPESPEEPSTPKTELNFGVEKGDIVTFTKISDDNDDIAVRIEGGKYGPIDIVDPNFELDFKFGKYKALNKVDKEFSEYEQLHELMENFMYIEEKVIPTTPPKQTDDEEAAELPKEAVETSTVTVDISKEELPASERAAHPEGVKIDLDVQIIPGSPEIKITGGTVTDKATVGIDFAAPGDTGETVTVPVQPQPNTEENPVNVNIIIEAPFQDASESIIAALKKIYMTNPEEDMLDYTNKLRKMTELDNICVHHDDDTYLINDKPEEGWFPQEEVKTVDINDQQIQMNLLTGMFGTANPAITHLQKFLKNHLTEEQNAGFLATGTFPTETVIVWNEKPYDLTVSIVKYKDGRFYRCYVAKTNPGLTDHSFIATKDIPDRWVRLGADIQDRNEYRTDYRGRR